jgi:hypothetical protein
MVITDNQQRIVEMLESSAGIHEQWTSNYTLYVTTCTMQDYKIARDGTISEVDWSRDR